MPRLAHLRARLAMFSEAQQRQRDLQVLLELTARYAEATDINELLHDVTRRLADELHIDRVAFVVVDGERGEGTIIAASDDAGPQGSPHRSRPLPRGARGAAHRQAGHRRRRARRTRCSKT